MTQPQNNDIISRLLSDEGTVIPDNKEMIDMENTSIESARVLSTRYKVYLLIVLVCLYIVVQYMFFPALEKLQQKQSALQNVVVQLQSFEAKRLQYLADAHFMQKMQEQEEILLNCINNNIACEALDPDLQEKKDIAIVMSKLTNMTDPIMGLDEKRILASLNDYALVRNPNNQGGRERNGLVESIRISDPVVYEGYVYRVPIQMTIKFLNKDGLMSFIDNIENTLSVNPLYRMLYIIDQINYDVVNYNQEQKSDISMSLFYYNPN